MEVENTKPRQKARELALITLYIYQITNNSKELLDFKWFEEFSSFCEEDKIFEINDEKEKKLIYEVASELIQGVISNLQKIDEVIKKHLVKWSFDRVREIDKAILRLSIYSIIYKYEIPSEVIISEANRLSSLYSEDNAHIYINGMLHKIKEEFRGGIKTIIQDKLE